MGKFLKNTTSDKHLLVVCCLFSFAVLTASYLAQYVWKIEPCRLCKLQRLPYFVVFLLPALFAFRIRPYFIRLAIIALFSMNAALSFYHVLVIGGVVKDFCAVQTNLKNIDDFMMMLESHVPCAKAAWKIFGIPASAYHLILSSVFIFYAVRTSKNTSSEIMT